MIKKPAPSHCLGCGRAAGNALRLCGTCRHTLAVLCYGRTRHYRNTAKTIELRERVVPGTEGMFAYECPVCDTWHTAIARPTSEVVHADAVLICLKLGRFHRDVLDHLAAAWSPDLVDRKTWGGATTVRVVAEAVPA